MAEAPTWMLWALAVEAVVVVCLAAWAAWDWWQRRNSVLMRGYLYHDKEASNALRGKVWYCADD